MEKNVVSLRKKETEFGKEWGFIHEGLITLRKAGMTSKLWKEITENEELARKIVASIKPDDKYKRAREIMGKNFFGIQEAIKYFGVSPTLPQLAALSEIPFSETVLKELKDTHILVAIFPISIFEIRNKAKRELFERYDESRYQDNFDDLSFAEERGEVNWQLIRKTPVPGSTSKTWEEQLSLLGKDDEVPTAQTLVYTIIGHYLATGERPIMNVVTSTKMFRTSARDNIVVKFSASEGLIFGHIPTECGWEDCGWIDVALSSARKHPEQSQRISFEISRICSR